LRALNEPKRRALYEFIAAQREPVTRLEAARALGIGSPLATFHLERLRRAGLLEIVAVGKESARRGRPPKRYRRAPGEVSLTLPPRDYALAAELLVEAQRPSWCRVRRRLATLARSRGREIGQSVRRRVVGRPVRARLLGALLGGLADIGYAPKLEGGAIRLTNCPFQALTSIHRAGICEMNAQLLGGVVSGLPECALRASFEPGDGCCVVIRARSPVWRLTSTTPSA